ncbi:hypothetical protein [Aeromicrobium sp.]|uniref:hypothetical protein n=1 Tax=Aeromicrobium sp. TaxID=1871063 RepID=UPI0028B15B66|nr:hypothetical protein [Aeromicrobium sp.]
MADQTAWPAADEAWLERYRRSIAGKHVPAAVLEQRERELLEAVRAADMPAIELFGKADVLAAEDAAELATVDEEVRESLGGGLRPALREVGHTLMGIGIVAVLIMFARHGWTIDLDLALTLVAAGVTIAFVGWTVTRALFASGRSGGAVSALVAAVAAALAAIATAAVLGADRIVARDVPTPLLALAMLMPGVTALVLASRMPQQRFRESWDDAQWLHRFRGALRSRLVPAPAAQGHVAELEQALAAAGTSAHDEFGDPVVLARQVAAADRVARTRRWWVSTVAGTGTPLVIAALVLANQSWGALTIPISVVLALAGLAAPVVRWDDRPWAKGA